MVMPYLPQGITWATLNPEEKLDALHKGLNQAWDALSLTAQEAVRKANQHTDQLLAGTALQIDEKFDLLSRRIAHLEPSPAPDQQ